MASMYFIADSKVSLQTIFANDFPGLDVDIITGDNQTSHITVANPPDTNDGRKIYEIPSSLSDWQTQILDSAHASNLKTEQEIETFISSME